MRKLGIHDLVGLVKFAIHRNPHLRGLQSSGVQLGRKLQGNISRFHSET